MDKLCASGDSINFNDPSYRLPTRPITHNTSSRVFEDFGTTFHAQTKSSQQSKSKQTRKPIQKGSSGAWPAGGHLDDITDSQSEDEIDFLSQPSDDHDMGHARKGKHKATDTDDASSALRNVQPHGHSQLSTSSVLKGLKFRKNKSASTSASGSQTEKHGIQMSLFSKVGQPDDQNSVKGLKPYRNDSETGSHRTYEDEWNAGITLPLHQGSNIRHTPQRRSSVEHTPTEPKQKPKILPRRVKKAPNNENVERNPESSKRKLVSPRPSMSDIPGKTTVKKPKVATIKKPSVDKSLLEGMRLPSSSSYESDASSTEELYDPRHRRRVRQSSQVKKKAEPKDFPLDLTPSDIPRKKCTKVTDLAPVPKAFPLSPLLEARAKKVLNGASTTIKRKSKAKNTVDSLFTDSEGGGASDTGSILVAQPFPMSSQMMFGNSSSEMTGPEHPTAEKRKPPDTEERPKIGRNDNVEMAANITYDYDEDEDTVTLSPNVDPRTLCPYCDSPLPLSPSPLLARLLIAVGKKSRPDPRPGNPLGRKAPSTAFITVCQRHRFESEILPQAERKGWPMKIDWKKLGDRVKRMRSSLQALIDDDPGDVEDDGWLETWKPQGARTRCIFWQEVMEEVKSKGSRALAGVRGQFSSFEKTQPGYYGEQGSVIIYQTLYNLFPPSAFSQDSVAPLTATEFIQRVLVPEVGVRLIMEDKSLQGDTGMEKAVQILRESSSYGATMFPDDMGERNAPKMKLGDQGGVVDEELGIGDLIVMERARKRRKELEEEGDEMFIEDGAPSSEQNDGEVDFPEAEIVPHRSKPRPKPIKNVNITSLGSLPTRRRMKTTKADAGDTDSAMDVSDTSSNTNTRGRHPSLSTNKFVPGIESKMTRTRAASRSVSKARSTQATRSSRNHDSDADNSDQRHVKVRKRVAPKLSNGREQNLNDATPVAKRRSNGENDDTPKVIRLHTSSIIPSRKKNTEPSSSGMTDDMNTVKRSHKSHSWLLSDTSRSSIDDH